MISRTLPARVAATIGLLACAFLLKDYYRQATAAELAWILTPTTVVVEWLSGLEFSRIGGIGWASMDGGVVIAPVCSGVNYLVIIFSLTGFAAIVQIRRLDLLCAWLAAAGPVAYGVTVCVNAIRIWASIALYESQGHGWLLTPEEMHRVVSVCIYYCGLFLYYGCLTLLVDLGTGNRYSPLRLSHCSVPLACYLAVTLGIPLLRRAESLGSHQFAAHLLTVGVTALVLTLVLAAPVNGLRRRVRRFIKIRQAAPPPAHHQVKDAEKTHYLDC